MMPDKYDDHDEGESDLVGDRNNEIGTVDNQELLSDEQADAAQGANKHYTDDRREVGKHP